VTYRNYATLYFIVISTSTESPLALIDLIQVYVEALDRLFENVCELDLIFSFEILHATLGEMIVGGVVVETNLDRIVAGIRAQGPIPKRPVNEGRASGPEFELGNGWQLRLAWPLTFGCPLENEDTSGTRGCGAGTSCPPANVQRSTKPKRTAQCIRRTYSRPLDSQGMSDSGSS
jgi:hypothetical protein